MGLSQNYHGTFLELLEKLDRQSCTMFNLEVIISL